MHVPGVVPMAEGDEQRWIWRRAGMLKRATGPFPAGKIGGWLRQALQVLREQPRLCARFPDSRVLDTVDGPEDPA